MSRQVAVGALASMTLALVPSVADAQTPTGELTDANRGPHRFGVETGLYYRDAADDLQVGVTQYTLSGTFTVADIEDVAVQLDAAWRITAVFGDFNAWRAANPYVGARVGVRGGEQGSQWRARGGLGLTIPISNLYGDFRSLFAGEHGLVAWALGPGMHGQYDAWLQLPLNMALVVRGDFEFRGEFVAAGADTAVGFLFPIEYDGRTGNTVIAMQVGGWGAGRPIPELALGLRLQAVAGIPTDGDSSTEGYVSLIPFVRAEIDEGAGFLEARWHLNLDEPFGWSYDASGMPEAQIGRIWAVYLFGGRNF